MVKRNKQCPTCDILILSTSKQCGSCSKLGRKHTQSRKHKIGISMSIYCKENRLKQTKVCLDCPKPVSALCADRCWDCYLKYNQGKNHHNWIDGRSYEEYPKEFRNIRETIILRDGEKCQGEGCTMTRNDHLLIYDRDVQVHHIDYNRFNNIEINLITTCQQCNLKANYDRSYWQEFYSRKLQVLL